MIPKPLKALGKADIDNLVLAKTPERQTLDYKVQLPGGSEEDKREFLGDVTSFANMAGGDLLFGISDERDATGKSTGRPRRAALTSDIGAEAPN